ncbi:MAG: hypothetical protein ACOCUV_02240, partial [bacterium]
MMGNIFNKYYLRDYINNVRNTLNSEIDRYEITDNFNIEEIIESIVSRFTIDPINIKEPKPHEPQETTQQVKNEWGEMYNRKVYFIEVTIPFDGNKDLFYCMPSAGTAIVYLDKGVEINTDYISATIVLTELDSTAFNNAVSKIIGTLKSNLPNIHKEISSWNNNIESFARQVIEQRKRIVLKKHDFMEQIGLKVNPSSDDFLVPNPVKKRKIPKPVTDSTSNNKVKTPILQDKVYKDIKEVLYHVGQAIERKPSLYKDKYEEDLRDMFLLFLETRYEATSGVGEAFNKKGKTDILLKYSKDGSNIFVAECKIWKGQKLFFEAIDQLLGYLTHRDSKTALMIFVDQKEATSVVDTV